MPPSDSEGSTSGMGEPRCAGFGHGGAQDAHLSAQSRRLTFHAKPEGGRVCDLTLAETQGDSMGSSGGGPGRLTTFLTAVAAVGAVASAYYAYQADSKSETAIAQAAEANDHASGAVDAAEEANRIGTEGLGLARTNEDRLNRQDAEGAFIGEAPIKLAAEHPLPPGVRVWFAVFNTTNTSIENVWVADGKGGTVRIEGIPRCEIYALDAGFRPTDLYYSDGNGLFWHRPYGGQPRQLSEADFPPMPRPDTHDSPWNVPLEPCSG